MVKIKRRMQVSITLEWRIKTSETKNAETFQKINPMKAQLLSLPFFNPLPRWLDHQLQRRRHPRHHREVRHQERRPEIRLACHQRFDTTW